MDLIGTFTSRDTPNYFSSKVTKGFSSKSDSSKVWQIDDEWGRRPILTPLLQNDFLGFGTGLSRDQLLQIADSVVMIAFDAHLFAQPIVANHFDHHVDRNRGNNKLSVEGLKTNAWNVRKRKRCIIGNPSVFCEILTGLVLGNGPIRRAMIICLQIKSMIFVDIRRRNAYFHRECQ